MLVRKPIATLTKEELEQVTTAAATLAQFARAHNMMLTGHRTFWYQLRKKYDLPEDIELDPATGEILPKKVTIDEVDAVIPAVPRGPMN